jgi:hypothetical protein
MNHSIYIGWEPREVVAWQIARGSLLRHCTRPFMVKQLSLADLVDRGLYKRPMGATPNGRIIDKLSVRSGYDGSQSTEHANARFFVPLLAREGWAIFTDGDVLFRADITPLFDELDPEKALYCVHHHHEPINRIKMDGCVQTRYTRKNWSSFMIFNCDHPKNKEPLAEVINTKPGRDLHAFCWLNDGDIGQLSREWNYLEGYTLGVPEPKMVHFTEGVPDMPGYENSQYASEWFAERDRLGLSQEVAA